MWNVVLLLIVVIATAVLFIGLITSSVNLGILIGLTLLFIIILILYNKYAYLMDEHETPVVQPVRPPVQAAHIKPVPQATVSNTPQKRSFSSGRLYRLIRTIVIVITSISACLSLLFIYLDFFVPKTYPTVCMKFCSDSNNNDKISCYKYYSHQTTELSTCLDTALKSNVDCMGRCIELDGESEQARNKVYLFTILLPLVFFGGTKLYKYLFPTPQENS